MERNERKSISRNISVSADRDSAFTLRKIIIDFFILFCVGMVILGFFLWGKPYERGFFCDDESLRHPYIESTVTSDMLYLFGLGLPTLTMCAMEWLRHRDSKARTPLLGRQVPEWVCEAYRTVGVFLFGCACQQLTTDIAKYAVGRLRPHFFAVCQPDVDCSMPEYRWLYVTEFTCRGRDPRLLKEMRLSFPSGHSSFSAYTMLYFSLYLERRLKWRGSKLLRHAVQLTLMMLAWYTAMTRVSNYKHHWSDVLAGFSIGLIYAVIIFAFLSGLRKSSFRRQSAVPHESEMRATNGGARQV